MSAFSTFANVEFEGEVRHRLRQYEPFCGCRPDPSPPSSGWLQPAAVRYGLASGAASTALQAAGNAAIVIGGRGFGGSFGGFGWMIESLNQ
jgi:hypothetical protein